jgi:SAM-dependent methyltransferase
VSFARRALADPAVTFLVAGADDLPWRAGGFEAAVSGLMLNFLPAPAQAQRSMCSRLRPGGLLAAYVWDYAEGMQFLRLFWEAALALDAGAAHLDESARFPLCRPEALVSLLERTGFEVVEAHALEIVMPFVDFNDYWAPFLGGTGPAPAYVGSLQPAARERLRLSLQQRLAPNGDEAFQLSARLGGARLQRIA